MFDQDFDDEEFELESQVEVSLESFIEDEQSDEPVWNVYENCAGFDDPEEIEDY